MATEVVILAQGTQARLGMSRGYKQLLPLPSCGNMPIIERTIRQVLDLAPASIVTLVTWQAVARALPIQAGVRWCELDEPGNSSLKGISRYIEQRSVVGVDATVVLFGDAVYSWECLGAIAGLLQAPGAGFVGTSDLLEDRGELWGVAWRKDQDDVMMCDLRDALLRHPPFNDTYQPGQMRRWLMGMRRGLLSGRVSDLSRVGRYVAVDDYTADVDIPRHITELPAWSVLAALDDAEHGMTW